MLTTLTTPLHHGSPITTSQATVAPNRSLLLLLLLGSTLHFQAFAFRNPVLRHAGLPAASVAYLAHHSTPKTLNEKKTADQRTPCPCITTTNTTITTTNPYDSLGIPTPT
ncbi:hypothetical protein CcaCcLH18_12308 [Colletotrichum camelliae]|nr:hypothetical protein CcaCcLH18_12308 [Colletotrichum camelliae]